MTRNDAEKKMFVTAIVNTFFNIAAVVSGLVFILATIPSFGIDDAAWLVAMSFVFFGTELLFLLPYPAFALPSRGLYAGGILGCYTVAKLESRHWYRVNATGKQIERLTKTVEEKSNLYTLPILELAIGAMLFIAGIAVMAVKHDSDISALMNWFIPFIVLEVLCLASGIFSNLYVLHITKELKY